MTHCLPTNYLQKSETVFVVAQGVQVSNEGHLTDKFNENFFSLHFITERQRPVKLLYFPYSYFKCLFHSPMSFPSPWSPYGSPWPFPVFPHPPLILTSSHGSSWHADIVISVIIYLLMQTWPCPRYALRQKYSYCSHCETNKEWDRRDINYCSAATVVHISLSSLSTQHTAHTHTHTEARVSYVCCQ